MFCCTHDGVRERRLHASLPVVAESGSKPCHTTFLHLAVLGDETTNCVMHEPGEMYRHMDCPTSEAVLLVMATGQTHVQSRCLCDHQLLSLIMIYKTYHLLLSQEQIPAAIAAIQDLCPRLIHIHDHLSRPGQSVHCPHPTDSDVRAHDPLCLPSQSISHPHPIDPVLGVHDHLGHSGCVPCHLVPETSLERRSCHWGCRYVPGLLPFWLLHPQQLFDLICFSIPREEKMNELNPLSKYLSTGRSS